MTRFTFDFIGFLAGAVLISSPAFALITSYAVNDREARPVRWSSDATIPSPERDPVTSAQGVQGFESGATWKDTLASVGTERDAGILRGGSSHGRNKDTLVAPSRVGIKPDRHSQNLRTMADAEARKCGVPPRLFRRLIARESGWNPGAVSPSGAIGLGQLMPATAAMLGVDPWDPQQNLHGAACYLSMVKGSGTWREALHSYHGGPNRTVTKQTSRDYADDILGAK